MNQKKHMMPVRLLCLILIAAFFAGFACAYEPEKTYAGQIQFYFQGQAQKKDDRWASQSGSKVLTVVKLECLKADRISGDNCQLEIIADNKPREILYRKMKDRDVWSINKSNISFQNTAKIRLVGKGDGANFKHETLFGETIIHGTSGVRTERFGKGRALYVITYKVDIVVSRPDRPDHRPDPRPDHPPYIPGIQKPKLQVYIRDEGLLERNIVKPRIYVKNVGQTVIRSFDLYYYFTTEHNKTPVLEDYYTPGCTVKLEREKLNRYYVRFRFERVNLRPGDILPNKNGVAIGIHYKDWSRMDKSNDYSNPGSKTWVPTEKVKVDIRS